MRTYPNLVQQMPLTHPEQLWVADITYILTRQETLYLHLVTDCLFKANYGLYVEPRFESRIHTQSLTDGT